MDFKLSEEQELLLESLDQFMDTCGFDDSYFAEKWQNNESTSEFDKAFLDSGFGLLGIPEEYGGTQVDLVTMVLVAERLASRGFPTTCMGNALQIDDMLTFGSEEQKKIVFDHLMATGQSCFSLGLTEPQAGSESANLATTVTHKDGKVIINGHKCFITNGKESPYILLMCAEADIEGHPASMYFVPNNAPGITISEMHKIGMHIGSLCDIYLENVELPESALVGEIGKGFLQEMKNFEIERLIMATNAMGMATCAFEDAARYANQRIQFGKTIGEFQLIQEMITECYAKILNMRNMCYYTAWRKDNGMSVRVEAGLAKYYCARAGFEVVDDAMQIMGGIGYTEDCRISRFWRDMRINRIGGGTDQIMIHTTSRQILKKYK